VVKAVLVELLQQPLVLVLEKVVMAVFLLVEVAAVEIL
jgi:hypothetical protein